MSSNEYHLDYYYRRRALIFQHYGGCCVRCGSTEDLEMDHIDRSAKTMQFQDCVTANWIREDVAEEMLNMQLLCNGCHIEKTAKENKGFEHGTIYAWMKKKCECEVCSDAKRKWHDDRNERRRQPDGPRGPYGLPAEHGTQKRYKRGCKCPDCRAANSKKCKEAREEKKAIKVR